MSEYEVKPSSLREQLIQEAERKPVLALVQFDGFTPGVNGADCVMQPDEDGDCLFRGFVNDLRNTDCLRITIPRSMSRGQAMRLITKILAWIERDELSLLDTGSAPMGIENTSMERRHADFDDPFSDP